VLEAERSEVSFQMSEVSFITIYYGKWPGKFGRKLESGAFG
jgi:hypothetical protein